MPAGTFPTDLRRTIMASFIAAISIAAIAMAISLAMLAESRRRDNTEHLHGEGWAIIDNEFIEY